MGWSLWSLLVMATPGGTSTRHTAGETSRIISDKDMHFKTQFCVKMYYLQGNNHLKPCSCLQSGLTHLFPQCSCSGVQWSVVTSAALLRG